jgi:peptide/nickel transport system substrate-binding protein
MRKVVLGVLAVAILGGAGWLLFGRGDSAPQTASSSATSTASIGPKTLRVGLVALPPDRGYPYNSTGIPTIYTYRAIFDGLTFVTADGEVQPFLATEWAQVDPLTWRFKLREGVTFSNGKPFNADAVVAAVQYLTRPGAVIDAIAREVVGIQSATAEGPHSLLIKTSRPEPLLPASMEQLLIVEPEHFAKLGRDGFAADPIGTGPFKVVNWGDARIDLVAFKESWRAPKVDALELIALPETSARVQALQSNQIDIGVALGYDNIAQLEQAGARMNVSHVTSTLGVTFILTRLPEGHPLLDKRVRQALNYALNKNEYIGAFLGGMTQAASQPTTKSGFGFNPDVKPYPYDPEKAKALLAEAGYKDGFTFTAEVTNGGGAALAETYQQVSADLARVGVNMVLRAITVPQLLRGVQQGEWSGEAFGMNFSSERMLDALRSVRLHSCINRNPWFCDKALTAKIEQAYKMGNLDERRALTQEIMAAYHDEAPVIWLHEVAMFEGLSSRVKTYNVAHTVIRYDLIELAP